MITEKNNRFDKWERPEIIDGVLTKWNWIVQNPEKLELGSYTDIGAFTYINSLNGVKIGRQTQIGSHCSIYSVSTIDDKSGPVTIGKNCRIGSHCTIMPGVHIGDNSIIGAHSFVPDSVPENVVAYGVPAKVIKRLDG